MIIYVQYKKHSQGENYEGEAAVGKPTDNFANRLLIVRVDRYIIDGDFGCARFEIDWSENAIAPSINYFTFANSQIT